MVLLCCNHTFNILTDESSIDWPTIISSAGAIIVGVLALWFSHKQTKIALLAKKQDEERAEIRKKLDELYGPLLQLRMKSNLLYQKFSESFRASDQNFSTLLYLLNHHAFTGNDKILIEEIIKIGALTEQLIHEKAGLIDDTNLRTIIFPRATTHFLVLRLAYQGALTGDINKFKSLTFPKELDMLLEKRKSELEEKLNNLYL